MVFPVPLQVGNIPLKFNIDDGTMELTENASSSTENEQNDATTTEDQMEYDAGCPFILEVKYNDGTQKEYELMTIDEDD